MSTTREEKYLPHHHRQQQQQQRLTTTLTTTNMSHRSEMNIVLHLHQHLPEIGHDRLNPTSRIRFRTGIPVAQCQQIR